MERFRISLEGEDLVFSAAHFLVFVDGGSEALHGHDYRVRVELAGPPDRDGVVLDFVELRRRLRRLVAALDHGVLLPTESASLEVERRDGEVLVTHEERAYRFPADDAVLLPIANTSTELLAGHLAELLAGELLPFAPELEEVLVEIEEAPGHAASVARSLGDPTPEAAT